MFGISWTEFLVIILVAICVVPAKYWPDVAKFFARIIKYAKQLIWKVNDYTEQIQNRLDLEKPIDDLIQNATKDVFGERVSKKKTNKRKK